MRCFGRLIFNASVRVKIFVSKFKALIITNKQDNLYLFIYLFIYLLTSSSLYPDIIPKKRHKHFLRLLIKHFENFQIIFKKHKSFDL